MFHVEPKDTICPYCNSAGSNVHILLKDHFLTKEDFAVVACGNCGLHYTWPRPSKETIGSYYKSEDYVSHSSTNKGLVNRAYNIVRKITLKKKLKLVEGLTSKRKLLDIGAGTGHFLKTMQDAGFSVLGLEPDAEARALAKSLNGVELKDLLELYVLDQKFDVLTMWHVMEHVYDLKQDLSRFVDLIEDKGFFIIAVPNYESYDARHYQDKWAAYDVPRHLYHFSEKVIMNMLQEHGMAYVKTLPMKFDAYYVSMLSEKYKGGGMLSALKTAWKSNRKAKTGGFSSQIYVFQKK